MSKSESSNFLNNKLNLSLASVLVLILLAVLGTITVTKKYPTTFGLLKGPEILKREEEEFIASVAKRINLPEEEYPTVASVTDLSQLESLPFFTKAQEDDKVLIYSDAKKVILYRPSEDKVIEVGTINIDEQVGQGIELDPVNRFAILNGTSSTDVTGFIESKLYEVRQEAQITTFDAIKKDYQTTILVDVKGDRAEEAGELASSLGISVGELPADEIAPEDVDFIIIIGQDQVAQDQVTTF